MENNNKIISALNSITRQKILIILLKSKNLTANEVYKNFIKARGHKISRDTIYRHLEILKAANLVKKIYNDLEKRLEYNLAFTQLIIKINNNGFNIQIN